MKKTTAPKLNDYPSPASGEAVKCLASLMEEISQQMVQTQEALEHTVKSVTTTTLLRLKKKTFRKYLWWTLIPLGKRKGQQWTPPKFLINPYLRLYMYCLDKCANKIKILDKEFNEQLNP